ncbi:hypothetical protein QE408_003134 [Agrobacterium larrymoorei]|uniref:MADS-box domain-containing protein n=1 Tax=Agrobacterium larrymoorei TaxID=160699 RepID=A0ABU0UMA7_9HYPH|nr:hypothetical protein [Agrobacterium larrymoorei]
MKRERFVDMEAFSRSIMLDRRGNRHESMMSLRPVRSSQHLLSWGKRRIAELKVGCDVAVVKFRKKKTSRETRFPPLG